MFEDVEEVQRLCRYGGEVDCEARVKELATLDESITLSDVLMHAIYDPEAFDEFKANILRQQEAERQRQLKMQRPAILRLMEAKEDEKIVEILTQEFTNEDGEVEFYKIDD